MDKIINFYLCFLFGIMSFSTQGFAAGELHLSFHVGGSGGGQAFVGGTLINSGDAPVAHSYVVVTTLDNQCRPQSSILQNFGVIEPGSQLTFTVPIVGALARYKIAGLKAFDYEGFELVAVDDNLEILQGREEAERESCSKAQK
jgi:hypothetical protein